MLAYCSYVHLVVLQEEERSMASTFRHAHSRFARSGGFVKQTNYSAVSFAPVAHAEDPHRILFEREEHPVIAQAEPEGTGQFAVQHVHIARAGAGEIQDAFEQPHGRGTVQGAHIGLGLIEPLDAVRRHY